MVELWLPQRDALQTLSNAYQDNVPGAQIVQLPTGCGKSSVIALSPRWLGYAASQHHCTILVVVPTLNLIHQTARAILETYNRHPNPESSSSYEEVALVTEIQSFDHLMENLPNPADLPSTIARSMHAHHQINQSSSGSEEDDDELEEVSITYYHFLVCNIHKLHHAGSHPSRAAAWMQLAERLHIVAIDEAHHIPAKMWHRCLSNPLRLGRAGIKRILVTATLFRSDGVPMQGAICYQYLYRDAIQSGLIKHPVMHLSNIPLRDRRDIEILKRVQCLLFTSTGERRYGQAIGYAKDICDAHRIVRLARKYTQLRALMWHSAMPAVMQALVRNRFEHPDQGLHD